MTSGDQIDGCPLPIWISEMTGIREFFQSWLAVGQNEPAIAHKGRGRRGRAHGVWLPKLVCARRYLFWWRGSGRRSVRGFGGRQELRVRTRLQRSSQKFFAW